MPSHQEYAYSSGREEGREQAATWHDERAEAMRLVYEHWCERRCPVPAEKCKERMNWHRDCAAEIRKLND